MPTAKAQLAGVDLDPIDGGTINYHVSDLSGTTTDILFQACAAVPFQRDAVFAPGLKVVAGPKVIEMRGNFAALVQITIGPDDQPQTGGGFTGTFELASGLVTELTSFDAGGSQIELMYDPNGLAVGGPVTGGTELPTQNGQAPKQIPVVVIRVTRKRDVLPIYSAYRHTGTTNAAAFLGMPPEYWLCTGVNAVSDDRNRTWIESLEFTANQFGWLQSCLYKLETGQFVKVTPSPVVQVNPPRLRLADQVGIAPRSTTHQSRFNGLTIVRVQGTSDFSRFNINLPANIDAA